jgi:Carboxypeptidase regulatory-like domain
MAHLSSYRRRSQPFRPLALLAFIVIFTVSAFAQDASTSAIRGTVSDATGLRIAGADVVTVNLATDLHRSTVSDAEGRFALDLLPPGDYSVRVIATGMTPTTRIRQHVDVGGSLLLDFQLAVAGGRETVTVESAPGEIETQAARSPA